MPLEGSDKADTSGVQLEHINLPTVVGHKPVVVLGVIHTHSQSRITTTAHEHNTVCY